VQTGHSYVNERAPQCFGYSGYSFDDPAFLTLEDGTVFEGRFFGRKKPALGEVVFTTAMYGYPELLTDPSYKGQMLVITHPLVGNYGVPEPITTDGVLYNFESDRVQVEALIVSECTDGSRYDSKWTLSQFLEEYDVPGVEGIDTRMLVKKLRLSGTMQGIISQSLNTGEIEKIYETTDFTRFTQPPHRIEHNSEAKHTLMVVDYGVKHGILKHLLDSGFRVVRVPGSWDTNKILDEEPDAVVLSNGPGNPLILQRQIQTVKELVEYGTPIFGICLGHQLLSLAMGCRVQKMPYGHRGVNKAVIEAPSNLCFITTHNHGYALNKQGLGDPNWVPWFYSIDDGFIEGFIHERQPIMSVQFHPEARPGVDDTAWLFKKFWRIVQKHCKQAPTAEF
jgi:carbamoyl-phosphate synthase small subunit